MLRTKHQKVTFLIGLNKHITLLSDANFPVRFRAQQRTKCNSLHLKANCCNYKASPTLYPTELRIASHRGHKFPPSLAPLLSFKTGIEWPQVLTATASFLNVVFQLLQCSRETSKLNGFQGCSGEKN